MSRLLTCWFLVLNYLLVVNGASLLLQHLKSKGPLSGQDIPSPWDAADDQDARFRLDGEENRSIKQPSHHLSSDSVHHYEARAAKLSEAPGIQRRGANYLDNTARKQDEAGAKETLTEYIPRPDYRIKAKRVVSGTQFDALIRSNNAPSAFKQELNSSVNSADESASMVLIWVTTIGSIFTICMTIAVFQCCCKKKQTSGECDEGTYTKSNNQSEGKPKTLRTEGKNGSRYTSKVSGQNGHATSGGDEADDMEDDTSLSVKDKIKAFETKQLIKGKEAVDHGKPTKRRPASKAFEEFENQGIIIGLAKAPKRKSAPILDHEKYDDGIPRSQSDWNTKSPILSDTSSKDSESTGAPQHGEDSTMSVDNPDAEFADIHRESEILKSFRRVPPPKNRSKRSIKRRTPERGPEDSSTTTVEPGKANEATNESPICTTPIRNEQERAQPIKTRESSHSGGQGSPHIGAHKPPDIVGEKSPDLKRPAATEHLRNDAKNARKSCDINNPGVTKENTEVENIASDDQTSPMECENIFMQIDPTARKRTEERERQKKKSATKPVTNGEEQEIISNQQNKNKYDKIKKFAVPSSEENEQEILKALKKKLKRNEDDEQLIEEKRSELTPKKNERSTPNDVPKYQVNIEQTDV